MTWNSPIRFDQHSLGDSLMKPFNTGHRAILNITQIFQKLTKNIFVHTHLNMPTVKQFQSKETPCKPTALGSGGKYMGINGRIVTTPSRHVIRSGLVMPLRKNGFKLLFNENKTLLQNSCMFLVVSDKQPDLFMIGSAKSEERLLATIRQETHPWTKVAVVSPMTALTQKDRADFMDNLYGLCQKSIKKKKAGCDKLVHALTSVEAGHHSKLRLNMIPLSATSVRPHNPEIQPYSSAFGPLPSENSTMDSRNNNVIAAFEADFDGEKAGPSTQQLYLDELGFENGTFVYSSRTHPLHRAQHCLPRRSCRNSY